MVFRTVQGGLTCQVGGLIEGQQVRWGISHVENLLQGHEELGSLIVDLERSQEVF